MADTVEFTASELRGCRMFYSPDGKYIAIGTFNFDGKRPYFELDGERIYVKNGQHLMPVGFDEEIRLEEEVTEFTPEELLGERVMFDVGPYLGKSIIKIDPIGPYFNWYGKRVYLRDDIDMIPFSLDEKIRVKVRK